MNNSINLGLTIGQEQEEEQVIKTWNFDFTTISLGPQQSFPIASILKILTSANPPTVNQLKEIIMSNNLDCMINTLVEFSDIDSNTVIDKLNALAIYDIGAKAFAEKMKKTYLYELLGFIHVTHTKTTSYQKNTAQCIHWWSYKWSPFKSPKLTCIAILVYRRKK